jgi:hypothetical protein
MYTGTDMQLEKTEILIVLSSNLDFIRRIAI